MVRHSMVQYGLASQCVRLRLQSRDRRWERDRTVGGAQCRCVGRRLTSFMASASSYTSPSSLILILHADEARVRVRVRESKIVEVACESPARQ
jgi:hypothetical protein